jgi:hypothetical protein
VKTARLRAQHELHYHSRREVLHGSPIRRPPLCILTTVLAAAQAPESVDNAAIAKIRDEGLNRSQVMETMFWLTDRYGRALTGSKEFEEAGDWAVKQLQQWGVANVRKERFQFGRGWSLVEVSRDDDRAARDADHRLPKSWTPAPAARSRPTSCAAIANAQTREVQGQLRGKIVLTQPRARVRMLDRRRIVLRYATDRKWIEEALSMPPRAGGAAARVQVRRRWRWCGAGPWRLLRRASGGRGGAHGRGAAPFNVNTFYKDEGVLALFDRGGNSDMRPAAAI